jgi:hypothetical protein
MFPMSEAAYKAFPVLGLRSCSQLVVMSKVCEWCTDLIRSENWQVGTNLGGVER